MGRDLFPHSCPLFFLAAANKDCLFYFHATIGALIIAYCTFLDNKLFLLHCFLMYLLLGGAGVVMNFLFVLVIIIKRPLER